MATIEFGSEHEALRYFRALSPTEREEHLWMGLREVAAVITTVSDNVAVVSGKQDYTNGNVDTTKKELAVHLEMHKLEIAEVDFMKRWGGRGTGALAVLISLGTFAAVIGDKFWR